MKIINCQQKKAFIPLIDKIVNLSYYHHDIDQEAANALLISNLWGSFLLRKGDGFGAIIISYKWCRDVYHKRLLYVLGNSKTCPYSCLSVNCENLFTNHHDPNCLQHNNMICYFSDKGRYPIHRTQPHSLKFLAASRVASNTGGNPSLLHRLIIPSQFVEYLLENFGVLLKNSHSLPKHPYDYFLACYPLIPILK